jgi:hypothetical protein
MTAPLIPEHTHPESIPPCPTCDAAAIARDREGLVKVLPMLVVQPREHTPDGRCIVPSWNEALAQARRLLAIPEAQEACPHCGHERHDLPGGGICMAAMCACATTPPEAQEADR